MTLFGYSIFTLAIFIPGMSNAYSYDYWPAIQAAMDNQLIAIDATANGSSSNNKINTSTAQSDIEYCLRSSLMGKDRYVKLMAHEFNCKPLKVAKNPLNVNEWIYTGNLSHRLANKTDDQVSFAFIVTDDFEIREFDLSLTKQGGFAGLAKSVPFNLGEAIRPLGDIADWMSEWDKYNSATWQDAATIIAGSTAVTVRNSLRRARRNNPAWEIEWMIDRPGSNYKRIELGPGLTPEDCRQQCVSDSLCKAWTWVPPGRQADNSQLCWLKDGVPDAIPTAGIVSGVKYSYEFPE